MKSNSLSQYIVPVSLLWALLAIPSWTLAAAGNPLITIDQLKHIMDNPEVIIIDVRTTKAWRDSPVKIKGAVRGAPKQFESWSRDFSRDKALVLY